MILAGTGIIDSVKATTVPAKIAMALPLVFTTPYSQNKIWNSPNVNGTSLTKANYSDTYFWGNFNDIENNGGIWVAVGNSINYTNFNQNIAYSYDGNNWTTASIDTNTINGLNIVKWNGSQWFTGGQSGKYCYSSDGINWTTGITFTTGTIWDAVWHQSAWWVASSTSGGAGKVHSSPDGITWTERYNSATPVWSIASNGSSLLVIVTSTGTNAPKTFYTNTGGFSWFQSTDLGYFNRGAGIGKLVWAGGTINRFLLSGVYATAPTVVQLIYTASNYPTNKSWQIVGGTSTIYGLSGNQSVVTRDLKWDGTYLWMTGDFFNATWPGVVFRTTNTTSWTTIMNGNTSGFQTSSVYAIGVKP
jgi:hypothetical protein